MVMCPLKRLVLLMTIQAALNLSKEGETNLGNVISSQVVASSERTSAGE